MYLISSELGMLTKVTGRWIYWILTIFSGTCFVVIYFSIPETHHPSILKRKAALKRKQTGDNRWHAPSERKKIPLGVLAKIILVKPWKVLFYEPMLLAITVYMSFIYGCLVSPSILPCVCDTNLTSTTWHDSTSSSKHTRSCSRTLNR